MGCKADLCRAFGDLRAEVSSLELSGDGKRVLISTMGEVSWDYQLKKENCESRPPEDVADCVLGHACLPAQRLFRMLRTDTDTCRASTCSRSKHHYAQYGNTTRTYKSDTSSAPRSGQGEIDSSSAGQKVGLLSHNSVIFTTLIHNLMKRSTLSLCFRKLMTPRR